MFTSFMSTIILNDVSSNSHYWKKIKDQWKKALVDLCDSNKSDPLLRMNNVDERHKGEYAFLCLLVQYERRWNQSIILKFRWLVSYSDYQRLGSAFPLWNVTAFPLWKIYLVRYYEWSTFTCEC